MVGAEHVLFARLVGAARQVDQRDDPGQDLHECIDVLANADSHLGAERPERFR